MITLYEKEEFKFIPKISFMQTACLISAFKDSPLMPDVWVQKSGDKITAVVSRLGGRLNITSEGGDPDEIKEFISVIGFSEIFCEKQTALSLGTKNFEEFSVLKKRCKKKEDAVFNFTLSSLYSALKAGEDGDVSLPEFEIFAPDVSHRLRHFSATAVVEEEGAALAFTCPFGGIISGISVKKEARNRRLGSRILTRLCNQTEGEIFVCTTKKNANFYIKNGFTEFGTAVIIRG